MSSPRPDDDLELARRVLGGSEEAWHELIDRYTGLLRHTIRRFVRDQDDAATVYVTVLERLYRGQLAQYKGEARLGTWLVFVARHAALDHLRRTRGRHRAPTAICALGPVEQMLYTWRYLQGWSVEAVRERWRERGLSPEELDVALDRMEQALTRTARRRLDWDRRARALAAESGRFLEYVEQEHADSASRSWAGTPEARRLEQEAAAAAGRVRRVLESLAPAEREAVALRFDRGLSARQIAAEMGLSGPRRAFTLLEAAVRHLRRALRNGAEAMHSGPLSTSELATDGPSNLVGRGESGADQRRGRRHPEGGEVEPW